MPLWSSFITVGNAFFLVRVGFYENEPAEEE